MEFWKASKIFLSATMRLLFLQMAFHTTPYACQEQPKALAILSNRTLKSMYYTHAREMISYAFHTMHAYCLRISLPAFPVSSLTTLLITAQ